MNELRERLLDIGTDHENHTLRVERVDDDPVEGIVGHWLLVCDTDDESGPLLDFAELFRRAVPEAGSREGLRAAADEFVEAVQSYLDPENQFTYSRRRHLDRTMAALVAAVDADDRAALGDTQEPRPDPLAALRDYFRAVDDIRDAGEARMGNPGAIAAMYRDAGDRKREAEKVLRAAASPAAPETPGAAPETREPSPTAECDRHLRGALCTCRIHTSPLDCEPA